MDVMSLVARLSLDSSEYMAGMAAAKGTAVSAGGNIAKSVANTKKAIGLAAVGMAGAMTAFGVSSVKTGMEFDKSMSQVAATMGKTMDEMTSETGTVELAWGSFTGNLREFAQEMGANTAFSASQAADALNYMALAGYDTQESMSMLPNVLNLAAAGNMDLARASDMVTDAQTAFGLSMEEMPQLVNEMAKAASTGNTSVEQLGDAFLTVGGLARELNGGFVTLSNGTKAPMSGVQELETALVAMANAGIKGSQAGTHMRNMLLKLSSPTSEGTKQLEALGVSVFDSEGKMRSLKDVFGDLNGALGNLTQEQKIQAISDLFNARDIASAEAILDAIGEDWDEIGASILDSKDAAGNMAETQLDNLAGDVVRLKSAFEGLQISVSDKLEGPLRKIVQALTWAIDNAGTLGPIILGLATAFGTFAVAINIGGIIKKVGTAFKALSMIMAANPIALIIAAIAGLVVAFITLWKTNENFRKAVTNAWVAIKNGVINAITGLKDGIEKAWASIKAAVGTAVEAIKAVVIVIFDGLKTYFTTVFNFYKTIIMAAWTIISTVVTTAVNAIKTVITVVFNAIKTYFTNVFNFYKTIITTAWNVIRTVVTTAVNAVKTVITTVFNAVKSFITSSVNGWKNIISSAWNLIKSVVSSAVNSVRSTVTSVFNSVRNTVSSIWNSIKEKISSAINSAKSRVSSAVSSIKSYLSFSGIGSRVASAFASVKSSISSKLEQAKSTVTGWISRIKGLFPFNIGKVFSGWVPKVSATVKKFFGGGGETKVSTSSVRFAKAMNQPYLFNRRQVFYESGEAGEEVLMGRQALKNDLADAVKGAGGDIIINLYYDASADANDMVRDIARGIQRYKMAGAI